VTVRVFDRLHSKGSAHTYVDRLAISLVVAGKTWLVRRIEHKPIAAERLKLKEFLDR
jgi:hypothetical protein